MMPDRKRSIALEDLLRLKRAERPPAEFWTEFDRQLRAKQLAALVAKRPWWHNVPRLFAGPNRYRIPIGATAVLALTFFAVRETGKISPAPRNDSNPEQSVAAATAVAAQPVSTSRAAAETVDANAPVAEERVATSATLRASEQDGAKSLIALSDSAAPSELAGMIPLLGAPAAESTNQEPSPSARHIAANLAVVQNSGPVISRGLLGVTTGFENRAMPARQAVEPLQQMTPPSERSRSRLIAAAMVSMTSTEFVNRSSDRNSTPVQIPEDRLYDREHRLGGRGDRVNWKF